MGLNLLEKTELWVNEITLDNTNLTDLANAVAAGLSPLFAASAGAGGRRVCRGGKPPGAGYRRSSGDRVPLPQKLSERRG